MHTERLLGCHLHDFQPRSRRHQKAIALAAHRFDGANAPIDWRTQFGSQQHVAQQVAEKRSHYAMCRVYPIYSS